MTDALQAGALGVLALLLVGLLRLSSQLVPLARDGLGAVLRVASSFDALKDQVAEARADLAEVRVIVNRLDGRGVCPVLDESERRREARATEPEVIT